MAGTPWNDAQRTEAMRIYLTDGLAAAHHATGIPKPTISRWADVEGCRLTDAAERTAGRNRAAADALHATTKRNLAESRAALVPRLAELAEVGLERSLVLARTSEDLRDVVGAFTRAIHDLQLLDGGATERQARIGEPEVVLEQAKATVSQLRAVAS